MAAEFHPRVNVFLPPLQPGAPEAFCAHEAARFAESLGVVLDLSALPELSGAVEWTLRRAEEDAAAAPPPAKRKRVPDRPSGLPGRFCEAVLRLWADGEEEEGEEEGPAWAAALAPEPLPASGCPREDFAARAALASAAKCAGRRSAGTPVLQARDLQPPPHRK